LSFSCPLWRGPEDVRQELSQRLAAFPFAESLDLNPLTPQHASLLQVPGVLPKLRRLCLKNDGTTCWGLEGPVSLQAVLSAIRAATQLTKLVLGVSCDHFQRRYGAPTGEVWRQLAGGMLLCPKLEELEIFDNWLAYNLLNAMPEAPAFEGVPMKEFRIAACGDLGSNLSPHVKSQLRRLEGVKVISFNHVVALAELTGLTRLELFGPHCVWEPRVETPELTPLSKLSALQELRIGTKAPLRTEQLRPLLLPMS
jgi:hypothetical protein